MALAGLINLQAENPGKAKGGVPLWCSKSHLHKRDECLKNCLLNQGIDRWRLLSVGADT